MRAASGPMRRLHDPNPTARLLRCCPIWRARPPRWSAKRSRYSRLSSVRSWLVLLAAAVLGLSNVVEPWLAALIVGFVTLALGAGLLFFGKSRLDADALALRRTINSL